MTDSPTDRLETEAEEHRRIRQVYADYGAAGKYRTLWADSAASRFMQERKWLVLLRELERSHAVIDDGWCLELGSGTTGDARRLQDHGKARLDIVVLDLLRECVAEARRRAPALHAVSGDAARLPLRDQSVSLVYQSTMLSSVLDAEVRARIFAEVRRVLRTGGLFISYDVRYANPWNRNTRHLPRRELSRAFTGWSQSAVSLTGIPQILRLLAPVSTTACRWVEALPVLRSHLLFVASRPPRRS